MIKHFQETEPRTEYKPQRFLPNLIRTRITKNFRIKINNTAIVFTFYLGYNL